MAVCGCWTGWVAEPTVRVPADQALLRLMEGNTRYATGQPLHPHLEAQRRVETAANGQKPFATVLACSDSRSPVELIFDQGIGDLFVVRMAGNVAGTDEIGSVEYGVEHLGTPILIVLGHTQCGAVTTVVKGAEQEGFLTKLLDHIKPAVIKVRKLGIADDALIPEAIRANVWQSIEDLFAGSDRIRAQVKAGKLKMVGAIYHLERGSIEWMGSHPEQTEWLKRADALEAPLAVHPSDKEEFTSDQVMQRLKEGNARFASLKPQHPNQTSERREATVAQGQRPMVTVLACSDSREPVELIFDQGVGDLFVVRVAGNVIGPDELGSLEYGVEHLDTPVLLVLGHTHCGAVTAVVNGMQLHGHLTPLAEKIKPAVRRARFQETNTVELAARAIESNVWQSIADIIDQSAGIRRRLKEEKVQIIGAVHDLKTGAVIWRGVHPEQDALLAQTDRATGGLPSPAGFAPSPPAAKGADSHLAPEKTHPLNLEEILAKLKSGNSNFAAGISVFPHQSFQRRLDTSNAGQKPFATVLTCSDSRVPVEWLFDQGIGDLFVVRVAGNVADTDEIAAMEYAVNHLGTSILLVMGHTHCGAVTAVMKGEGLQGRLPELLDNIRPAVDRVRRNGELTDALLLQGVQANVRQSISDILRRSRLIRRPLQDGNLLIIGAIYDVERGTIDWLDSRNQ